jgi:predicted 3-demethylubiquinone-9 3-methyltransferase (glyoxalase superfamily)
MALSKKITSNLWFDSEAEDAARFYVSVFKMLLSAGSPTMARKVSNSMVNSQERSGPLNLNWKDKN